MAASNTLRGALALEMWVALLLPGCGRTDPVPDDEEDFAQLADEEDDDAVELPVELGSSVPAVCGDGVLDFGEECEPADGDLGASCESLGFAGGELACGDDCRYALAECFTCGDGIVSDAEQCDGQNVADLGCTDLGYTSGVLACTDCFFDVSRCNTCGNGVVEGAEDCEPGVALATTCADLGLAGAAVGCSADCTFDPSACTADPF
jgi:hypothetical protein